MKKLLTITKGPSNFERFITKMADDEKEVVKTKDTEKVEFTEEQFLVSDGKSYWLVDEDMIKIEQVTDVLSNESCYKVYQSGQILETSKEIKKVNF